MKEQLGGSDARDSGPNDGAQGHSDLSAAVHQKILEADCGQNDAAHLHKSFKAVMLEHLSQEFDTPSYHLATSSVEGLFTYYKYPSMTLQHARVRLHEDQVILRNSAPKMAIGDISEPDSLGWRWFQCTESLQVYLPPDAAARYNVFLKAERARASSSSHTNGKRFNAARRDFINQCLQAKPSYPVRGITPSERRYALEPGFSTCQSVDAIVDKEQQIAEAFSMTTFESRLVPCSELGILGERDEWGRSWLRLNDDTQVLMPADTTYQYHAFVLCSILSNTPQSAYESSLCGFLRSCKENARYLGLYRGDRLYVLEKSMEASVIAALDGVLRTYYLGLAEGAWCYARDAPLKLQQTKHAKSKPKRFPATNSRGKRLPRRRRDKFVSALEILVEVDEGDSDGRDDDAQSEWDSDSSLSFSVTSTLRNSIEQDGDSKDLGGSSLQTRVEDKSLLRGVARVLGMLHDPS